MAEIYSTGQQSVNAIGGGLRFEQDNNRIIGRDENNIPNLIIVSNPGEVPLIEIAKVGFDVLTTTDDNKIMTSKYPNLFCYSGPETVVVNYTASSGSATANMATLIPFTDVPSTPSVRANLIHVDDGWAGNIRYAVPYTEYTSAGAVIFYALPFIAAGPTYWAVGVKVIIPTTSSYYAGNHKFEFVTRATNI